MPTPDYADITPAGYGGAYSSISSCIAGENRDFVASDVNAIWEFVGAGWATEGPDITSGGIYGGVCDATRNILIRADAINRASAQWDPSKAYIHVDGGWPCFELDQTHITIDGIQMTSNQGVVGYNCTGLVVENCHILRDGDVGGRGLHGQSDGAVIRNCVIDGFERGVDVGSTTDHLVDHCTIVNGWWAVQGADGAVVTNTLCYGQEVFSFPVAVLLGSSNNATGDTGTAGTAGITEISDPFVDYASGDYHLDPTDVQGIIGGGVATLALDIDGNAYLDPPSIGAHEGAEGSGEIDPIGENVEVGITTSEGLTALSENVEVGITTSEGLTALSENVEVGVTTSQGLTALSEGVDVGVSTSQGLTALSESVALTITISRGLCALGQNVEVGTSTSEGLTALAQGLNVGVTTSEGLTALGQNVDVNTSTSEALTALAHGIDIAVTTSEGTSTATAVGHDVEVVIEITQGLCALGRDVEVGVTSSEGLTALTQNVEVGTTTSEGLTALSRSVEVEVTTSEATSSTIGIPESVEVTIEITRGLCVLGQNVEVGLTSSEGLSVLGHSVNIAITTSLGGEPAVTIAPIVTVVHTPFTLSTVHEPFILSVSHVPSTIRISPMLAAKVAHTGHALNIGSYTITVSSGDLVGSSMILRVGHYEGSDMITDFELSSETDESGQLTWTPSGLSGVVAIALNAATVDALPESNNTYQLSLLPLSGGGPLWSGSGALKVVSAFAA